ncbi:MAG: alpha/beta hydrolase [Proteobacteria bacterium]|nr:alpha/beta hydrolase [Pseudomonadota bacterium]
MPEPHRLPPCRRRGGRFRPGALALAVLSVSACAGAPRAQEADSGVILTGSGSPVVVLQAGFGDSKETWSRIIPDLARDHTVFAYDRPGSGGSPPTAAPRDPCSIAAELRARLGAAGLRPPYVLVGHSLGGLYQYVYAKLYPADVAGFVLVDPTHPRNWEAVQSGQPEAAMLIKALKAVAWSDVQRREFDGQTDCLDRLDMATPLALKGRVLISGRPQPEASEDYERRRQALGQDWRRMAGVAQAEIVWASSHFIQKEQPATVIAAIREVSGRVPAQAPAIQPEATVTLGRLPPITLQPGRTSRAQVEATLGKPGEILHDGAREIWIYSDKPIRLPWAVSIIPVIGDVAEAVRLIQDTRVQHELVLQFDEQGLILDHALRQINGQAAGS